MGVAQLVEEGVAKTAEAEHGAAEVGQTAAKKSADSAAGEAAIKRSPAVDKMKERLAGVATILEMVSLVPGANIPASIAACAIRLVEGDYTGAVLDLVGIIPMGGLLKVGKNLFPLLKKIAAEAFPAGVEVVERLSQAHLENFSEKATTGEMAGQKVHFAAFKEEARLTEESAMHAAQGAQRENAKLRALLPENAEKWQAAVHEVNAEYEEVGGAERWGLAIYGGDFERYASGTTFSEVKNLQIAARAAGDWDEVSRLSNVLENMHTEYRSLAGYVEGLQAVKNYAHQGYKDAEIGRHLGLSEEVVRKVIKEGAPTAKVELAELRFEAKSGTLVSAPHVAKPAIER